MATRAVASAVFPTPIEKVWKEFRDFTFPGKHISTIASCTMEDNMPPTAVGAVRTLKWKTGESRKHRLLELSDQHYRIVWELIEADPPTEVSGSISTLSLYRVTETNQTLVQWESDFSSDVKNEVITFEQKSYAHNLEEIRNSISKQ
eukprot:TRINITY_DN524_c0_g1_i1.p1 TRINITY_DN524_c0_g1~~TRINITY_DN524_c0_g1_i1.p1  ORF type:complete len:161 (+),score=31.60 TRINITY_DN524_c0_g1_i1:43-483(+)